MSLLDFSRLILSMFGVVCAWKGLCFGFRLGFHLIKG